MSKSSAGVRGAGRLLVEATLGMTDVVEAVHAAIARTAMRGLPLRGLAGGITGLAYDGVRGVARLAGGGLDALLALAPPLAEERASPRRDALLAVLNGIVGDHLAASGNPLAIPMHFRHDGRALRPGHTSVRDPGGRLLVLVHGLCMNDRHWARNGHDHGTALARDLGSTPLRLRFNSGLHVSTNGRSFDALLEELVRRWPVPVRELTILGHSSGGLVARSAAHYGRAAGHRWPRLLRHLVFLGTPHHGSPIERCGSWIHAALGTTAYTAPLARLGRIRSAGVTDLRHGNLVDEDWQGHDRFLRGGDRRRRVPLPAGVRCYAVAASARRRGPLSRHLPADGLVPVESALGRHHDPRLALRIPAARRFIAYGTGHFDLLSSPAVYEKVAGWLAGD